jgi:hypothetical protein
MTFTRLFLDARKQGFRPLADLIIATAALLRLANKLQISEEIG